MNGQLHANAGSSGNLPPPEKNSRILIVGLGNPILGDDGVGWHVCREVQASLRDRDGVEIDTLAVGGLSLMERMLGYDRVILVDSINSSDNPRGSVSRLTLQDLRNPRLGHSSSAHDASLSTALQTAMAMGAAVPGCVEIVAVEVQSCNVFSEELSPAVASAVPIAAQQVLDLLDY